MFVLAEAYECQAETYAAEGNFEAAVSYQKKSVAMAKRTNLGDVKDREKQLKMYSQGKNSVGD